MSEEQEKLIKSEQEKLIKSLAFDLSHEMSGIKALPENCAKSVSKEIRRKAEYARTFRTVRLQHSDWSTDQIRERTKKIINELYPTEFQN